MKVIIEIPINSNIKYEYHQGVLMVDRVLGMSYPGNYGYVQDTLALDGDELDVILLVPYPLHIGCRIECRAVGVMCMEDEEGVDHKLLAVPSIDPEYNGINDITDVSHEKLDAIRNFFEEYKKKDPTRWSRVEGIFDRHKALEILREAQERFQS